MVTRAPLLTRPERAAHSAPTKGGAAQTVAGRPRSLRTSPPVTASAIATATATLPPPPSHPMRVRVDSNRRPIARPAQPPPPPSSSSPTAATAATTTSATSVTPATGHADVSGKAVASPAALTAPALPVPPPVAPPDPPADKPPAPGSDSGSSSSAATEADNSEDEHPQPSSSLLPSVRSEAAFSQTLLDRGLRIVDMRPDGNCLFRALAYALLGDAEAHGVCRARIMKYLVDERDYFSQFVAEDFSRYVRRKSRDGTHGNHLELQAAAELYGRRIEVYSYADTPATIIEPWVGDGAAAAAAADQRQQRDRLLRDDDPIRLSFHRGCHYNVVVPVRPQKYAKHKGSAQAHHHPTTQQEPTTTSAPSPPSSSSSSAAATAAAPNYHHHRNQHQQQHPAAAAASSSSSSSSAPPVHSEAEPLDDYTEAEVERAVLALSLVEATGAGSSAAAPSGVLALVNAGYSWEMANESYRVAGHAGLAEMVRYLTSVAGPAPAPRRPRRHHHSRKPPSGGGSSARPRTASGGGGSSSSSSNAAPSSAAGSEKSRGDGGASYG